MEERLVTGEMAWGIVLEKKRKRSRGGREQSSKRKEWSRRRESNPHGE